MNVAHDWLFPLVAGIAFLIGCGSPEPKRATVDGQITYEGEPVPFGHIVFIPVDGWDGFYSQTQIVNGKYSMEEHGPVIGKNRVEIHGHRKTGVKSPDISGVRLNEPTEIIEETKPYLPLKYNVASELTIEITPGKNSNLDFHLD